MRVKQVDSWNGQREDPGRRKEEGRGVFVRPTYFPPRPSCPLQRIPFLPTADWLSSLLFALPSLHGFVADVWALSREKERERENGVSRTLPKTGRGDITEGDHQSCASPGTWICLFFHSFLFPSPLLLDKIQWNKWKGDDKSCPPIASYSGLRL